VNKISRREFIRVSALATAGVAVAACAKATEEPVVVPTATSAPVEKATATPVPVEEPEAKEAPMLAEKVSAGSLLPLEERLPASPNVMPVMEEIGKFGGSIRRGFKGVSDRWGPTKHNDRGLVWFDKDLVFQPRIAESWEINGDASEWTFHLRRGTKYSDGSPFDSDSFKWSWENRYTNETLTTSPPTGLSTGTPRVLAEMTFPDMYTFVLKFADPNPMYLDRLGRWRDFWTPGEYMGQFHPDFADKAALDKAVTDSGFETWDQLFVDRLYWYMSPDKPEVMPWPAQNALSEELFVMQRNPYFWATDPDGQQLPYLDKVNHRLFETTEVLNMWIVGGEIDFQARHVGIANYTLYKESEESGDYQVFLGTAAGHQCLQLNQTCKEPRMREFAQDRKVRIALSLAVNRDELNELVYDGLLTPRQYSPLEKSPNAYPKLANAYIEYDPDEANRLLDEAGYTEKDADGFRLWKDGSGETLSFVVEGTSLVTGDDMEVISSYFADVGIKATYQFLERSLYTEHFQANELQAAYWGGDRTVLPLVPGAPIFLGTMIDRPWCPAWGLWRSSSGTDPVGEEPPEGHWIWDIWAIWDQIVLEPDPDQRNKLFEGIMDIWAEELPQIGYLGESPTPIIVRNGFRNYLNGYPLDDTTGDEHLLNTETYFWEDPAAHAG
jgi:peptide/nickel transport system substrate-binding protein